MDTKKVESWMPSDEEIDEGTRLNSYTAWRDLIRTTVERALAAQEARWIAALKEAQGEYQCHPSFRELWEKAESSPGYWAEVLKLSAAAYSEQEARHRREVIEARIDAIENFDGWTSFEWVKEVRAKLAALEEGS